MDDELIHEYDPVKRREYYLRTRELKGRAKAAAKSVTPRKRATKPKPPAKTKAQRQAERRRKLEAQVEQLKNKLARLKEELAVRVKQAQARSGHKPKKSRSGKASGSRTTIGQSTTKTAKLTATQKAKAAKRSKEYYEKNKDQLLADEVKSLKSKIKTVQERIDKMRKDGSIGARKK